MKPFVYCMYACVYMYRYASVRTLYVAPLKNFTETLQISTHNVLFYFKDYYWMFKICYSIRLRDVTDYGLVMLFRVCLPPEPFLVVLYSVLCSKPEFYECTLESGTPHMDYTLAACHDVIQLNKVRALFGYEFKTAL